MIKAISLVGLLTVTFLSCNNFTNQPKDQSTPDYSFKHSADRYQVAILLLPGTYNTELTAPMDIFQHTQYREGIKAMDVFTISNTNNLVTTFEGLKIKPDYNYLDSVPPIDILVVPAAEHSMDSDLENDTLISFLREVSSSALWVTSHCDGAFVLAQTGILDNVWSTTFPSDVDQYRKQFPHLKVKENVLFVRDGKYITSAGGAKSFEASLYLTELMYGTEIAKKLAKGLVIDWDKNNFEFYDDEIQ